MLLFVYLNGIGGRLAGVRATAAIPSGLQESLGSEAMRFLSALALILFASNVLAQDVDWNYQVVVRPGAKACIYLHFPKWEDADKCHKVEGDVAVERVDQPPFRDWIRVVTTDDNEEPAFYVHQQDLENYNTAGQSWSKKK